MRASLLAFVFAVTAPAAAFAGSHMWRFSEFYSSPDRSVQFIEMKEISGSSTERNIDEHWFKTDAYNQDESELLGDELHGDTAFKKFLVGTPSYAALPGVPQPDYFIPDGAIDPDGDTVVWWFYQTIAIPPATMPSDGVHSIVVVGAQPADPQNPVYSVEVNSPTNFAGETGSVDLGGAAIPALPSQWGVAALLLAIGAVALTVVRRRAVA